MVNLDLLVLGVPAHGTGVTVPAKLSFLVKLFEVLQAL